MRSCALDISTALAREGVQVVLAEDLPAARHGLFTSDWPILVGLGYRVRTLGTPGFDRRTQASTRMPLRRSSRWNWNPASAFHAPSGAGRSSPLARKRKPAQAYPEFAKAIPNKDFGMLRSLSNTAFSRPLRTTCSWNRNAAVPLPDGRMEVYVGSQIRLFRPGDQVAAALGVEQVRLRGQHGRRLRRGHRRPDPRCASPVRRANR